MPTNEPRPTKAQRRDDARAKALQLRKEQERKAKRNRLIAILALVVAVVAIAGIAFVIVKQDQDKAAANSSVVYGGGEDDLVAPKLSDVTAPSTATDDGAIPVSADGTGQSADGVVVKVYFDFMCPFCGQFDRLNASTLDSAVSGGGVTVEYHPISFLDHLSQGTHYSTRAANAAAVVADKDPEHFTAFVTAMYAEGTQPEENTDGLTDAQIKDVATGVGVPADVADQFTTTETGTYQVGTGDNPTTKDGEWRTFAPWVAAGTAQAGTDLPKLTTPTILIDGEDFTDWQTPGALESAIEAAKAAKG